MNRERHLGSEACWEYISRSPIRTANSSPTMWNARGENPSLERKTLAPLMAVATATRNALSARPVLGCQARRSSSDYRYGLASLPCLLLNVKTSCQVLCRDMADMCQTFHEGHASVIRANVALHLRYHAEAPLTLDPAGVGSRG